MAKFQGFDEPTQNWSKLPHQLIDALPLVETVAEMKCILYILRHTWGFSEFGAPKRITMDEFCHGRKTRDGTRLDAGLGMGKQAIRKGLQRAVEHGFINIMTDDSDAGRIEKYYILAMAHVGDNTQGGDLHPPVEARIHERGVTVLTQGGEDHPPEGWKSPPRGVKITPRTEKETKERNQKKERRDGNSEKPDEKDLLWQQALADLKLQMPKSTFDAWLLGTTVLDFDGETLRVEVRNALAMDWLGQRLNGKIEQVIANIAGRELAVEFEAKGERPHG